MTSNIEAHELLGGPEELLEEPKSEHSLSPQVTTD
jgi:hypothetical protein